MGRKSLPPGFRFHPTDVELVLYYLKRKVMGKKFHYEAIAEVNIYKFSPWDLPVKSCLKSKDQEWFFFCPREKKYASGVRVKRATENGYWKTTGKDRTISNNEKTVGAVKTLVFHVGHAPRGERTDWVMHEYRIVDDQLAAAGLQDMYVLCKVFHKDGPGPKNGAQYGAPFNEADWADDDVDDAENPAISLASDAPSPTILIQTQEPDFSLERGLLAPGNTTGLCLVEEGPSTSAGGPTRDVVASETDDDVLLCLLDSFTDEHMLPSNDSGFNKDEPSSKGMNEDLPCSDGHDIYNGLGDLDSWSQMNDGRLDFTWMQNDDYSLNNMLPQDNSTYIELNDLALPLDCSNGVTGTDQSSPCEIYGSSSHENAQQLHLGPSFAGMNQYGSCTNGLPVPPEGSYEGDSCLDVFPMVDNQIYQETDGSYNLEFTFGQMENAVYPANDMERASFGRLHKPLIFSVGAAGSHIEKCYSRLMECNPARLPSAAEHLALSFSPCGGSSIHIKAEVTHGAGECTNEALSVMVGGSGSCWCNLPWAVFPKLLLFVNHLLYLVEFGFGLTSVYCCYLDETVSWSYYHAN